ncbi:MAG: hypothetical protein DI568_08060 [Sphingomonas sp.]|nr:MAG: hypothetical protein DI568_08060 [Sphingomonas sp.]
MSLALVRISGRRTALAVALTLVLAMLFSNIVHAAEQICPPVTAASTGDSGGSDHAGDSGVIHQHGGCHGHHLASPAPRASAGFLVYGRSPEVPAGEIHRSQSPPDHLLRPPIA